VVEAWGLLSLRTMATLDARRASSRTAASRQPVNEWGVYDPAIAGIEALFARIDPDGRKRAADRRRTPGRPAPRRRRARHASDSTGVCLAIAEAIARAQQQAPPPPDPVVVAAAETAMPAPSRARARRAPTAMWVRTLTAMDSETEVPVHDNVLGIFAELRITPSVALIQYGRGCRISEIRIAGSQEP
jgi:hypothetical protein